MATKPSSKPNTLTIEHLSYSYQNGDRTQTILNDISAEFKSGKVYAIVGESGSGKTTFLGLISALGEDTEARIIDLFRDLAHKGHKIVIIVTHSRRVADRADAVLALRRGQLS